MAEINFDEDMPEELAIFLREFCGDTDRAAVILGAAKLDLQLYQVIQKVLVPCTSSRDELLDGDSPLGTFSAKINLAYRLGLIDALFCRSLHLVRKIRNAFAHELLGVSLTSGPHRDRVRELFAPFKRYPFFDEYLVWTKEADDLEDAAAEFRLAVCWMVSRLTVAFDLYHTVSANFRMSLLGEDSTNRGTRKRQ